MVGATLIIPGDVVENVGAQGIDISPLVMKQMMNKERAMTSDIRVQSAWHGRPALYIACLAALVLGGSGPFSVDAVIARRRGAGVGAGIEPGQE